MRCLSKALKRNVGWPLPFERTQDHRRRTLRLLPVFCSADAAAVMEEAHCLPGRHWKVSEGHAPLLSSMAVGLAQAEPVYRVQAAEELHEHGSQTVTSSNEKSSNDGHLASVLRLV